MKIKESKDQRTKLGFEHLCSYLAIIMPAISPHAFKPSAYS